MPTDIRWLSGAIPEWWRPLLQIWGELMDKYWEINPTDAPYWHGEAPLTGFLVAAAWQHPNGWGLVEFPAPRMWSDTRAWGAGDAWIGRGEGSWCALEAKVPPIFTTNLEDAYQKCRDALRQAADELRSLDQEYRGNNPIAVCYMVPNLLERGRESTSERINALFEGIAGRFRNEQSMIAIYRPAGTNSRTDEGRLWPGVVLVGEAVA